MRTADRAFQQTLAEFMHGPGCGLCIVAESQRRGFAASQQPPTGQRIGQRQSLRQLGRGESQLRDQVGTPITSASCSQARAGSGHAFKPRAKPSMVIDR